MQVKYVLEPTWMLLCGAEQEVATVPRSGCTAKPPREELRNLDTQALPQTN